MDDILSKKLSPSALNSSDKSNMSTIEANNDNDNSVVPDMLNSASSDQLARAPDSPGIIIIIFCFLKVYIYFSILFETISMLAPRPPRGQKQRTLKRRPAQVTHLSIQSCVIKLFILKNIIIVATAIAHFATTSQRLFIG